MTQEGAYELSIMGFHRFRPLYRRQFRLWRHIVPDSNSTALPKSDVVAIDGTQTMRQGALVTIGDPITRRLAKKSQIGRASNYSDHRVHFRESGR